MKEIPVVFGRGRSLLGVACIPHDTARCDGAPFVVFLNAGIIHRVGPNRLYVKIARALANNGISSLRFDLGGIGDSSVVPGETGTVFDFVRRDVKDALDWVAKYNGEAGVVLVGLCSGADNALHQGAMVDTRVVGAVLIDPDVHRPFSFFFHHYIKAMLAPRTWILLLTGRHPIFKRLQSVWARSFNKSAETVDEVFLKPTEIPGRSEMEAKLQQLLARNCRLYYFFTGGLSERYNHKNQLFKSYPSLYGTPLVHLQYLHDAGHTFSRPDHQDQLVDSIVAWLINERR